MHHVDNTPVSSYSLKIINDLISTRDQTLACFDLSENDLLKTYAMGKWSVRELLNHLADAETVLYDRIRRTISKPKQVLWGFDQEAWSLGLDYKIFPLQLNKSIYLAVRESVIFLAEKYYEELGHLEFVHSETGLRKLKDEFDKVARHNAHHLEQIKKALAQ